MILCPTESSSRLDAPRLPGTNIKPQGGASDRDLKLPSKPEAVSSAKKLMADMMPVRMSVIGHSEHRCFAQGRAISGVCSTLSYASTSATTARAVALRWRLHFCKGTGRGRDQRLDHKAGGLMNSRVRLPSCELQP